LQVDHQWKCVPSIRHHFTACHIRS
jgi:hypothetical protein